MGAFKDLSGQRFNRLEAIKVAEKRGKNYYYECVCDCGNRKLVRAGALTSGEVKSCGCLQREWAKKPKGKKKNEYKKVGEHIEVCLTNSDKIMVCDCEDWKKAKEYTWFIDANGYAATNAIYKGKKQIVRFHLLLFGVKDGLVTDHANRNKLDNRKCNLRHVTQHANTINQSLRSTNTSGYPGIKLRKDTNRWSASLTIDGKQISLGCYNTKEEAIAARKMGEEKYFLPLFA